MRSCVFLNPAVAKLRVIGDEMGTLRALAQNYPPNL